MLNTLDDNELKKKNIKIFLINRNYYHNYNNNSSCCSHCSKK